MTFDRIKGWYEAFDENVYFSYSGGKDSTVLLEMVAVFAKSTDIHCMLRFAIRVLNIPKSEYLRRQMQRELPKNTE